MPARPARDDADVADGGPLSTALPTPRTRIRVYWSEERAWYAGVVTSNRDDLTHVTYDKVGNNRVERLWHDLRTEVWEVEPSLSR